MLFIYRAIDQQGNKKEGTITAISEDVAISSLQRRGFIISEITSADKNDSILNMNISWLERVSPKDIVLLSRQLATLFKAQVSALKIFRLIGAENENPKLSRTLMDIAEQLQAGSSISGALSQHPKIFDGFYVNMVKAGEESGRLDETFQYLADSLDRSYEINSKARNALVYPAFIIITFITVMSLMLTLVIPQISAILVESGQDIPLYTQVVIGLSDFLINYGWILLVLAAVGVFALIRLNKTKSGKMMLDDFKMSIPYVGDLFQKLYLSRVADNMDTMLGSGIPMVKALELTEDVVDSELYAEIIRRATKDVQDGSSLSDAFSKFPEFPGIMVQLVRVGEETGNLGEILGTLAKFYRREVTNAVDTLVGMIEPIMIVLLAVGVGFLLASVLIPIYNISAAF